MSRRSMVGETMIMKVREYQIHWHNLIVAHSVKEAVRLVQSILEDLKKLEQLEKEGKIKGKCLDASPSIQQIVVLDKSIEPELRKISLVGCLKYETEEDE